LIIFNLITTIWYLEFLEILEQFIRELGEELKADILEQAEQSIEPNRALTMEVLMLKITPSQHTSEGLDAQRGCKQLATQQKCSVIGQIDLG
jgi:hypothetical protein